MKKQYPFYSGSYFYNQKKEIVAITLKDVIIHYILNIFNKSHLYKNKKNNNHVSLALSFKYFFLKKKLILANDIVVIPLGHATVLVMYQNKAILFDPLFFSGSLFLKRYAENIDINILPKIDIIVFSHNHPDHYNLEDLRSIINHSPMVEIIAPLMFDEFLKKENISVTKMTVMNWWEEKSLFFDMIKITALPAVHWSQSNIFNRNKVLWSSWMLSINEVNIYFAGDTAYGDHFKSIKETFKKIDIACLPIAPYKPIKIQVDSHMNVEESYQSFLDLGEPIFIPIHWGVFAYGDEPFKEPIEKIIELFIIHNNIKKLKSTTINVPYICKINKKEVVG